MPKIHSNDDDASLDEQEEVEECFLCGEALDEVAGCSCTSGEEEACDCSECD
jgi:hypothetical protein